jgi:hypothetical protein
VISGFIAAQGIVANSTGAAPRCEFHDIQISRSPENGAGGTEGVPFVLRYTGAGGCTLDGFAAIRFIGVNGEAFRLRTSRTKLSYFSYRRPTPVTLTRTRSASFGIEFTQNLNQREHGVNCIAPTALVMAPLRDSNVSVPLKVTWPTGKIIWNYAIDWCFAGWSYRETAIEPGSSPSQV